MVGVTQSSAILAAAALLFPSAVSALVLATRGTTVEDENRAQVDGILLSPIKEGDNGPDKGLSTSTIIGIALGIGLAALLVTTFCLLRRCNWPPFSGRTPRHDFPPSSNYPSKYKQTELAAMRPSQEHTNHPPISPPPPVVSRSGNKHLDS